MNLTQIKSWYPSPVKALLRTLGGSPVEPHCPICRRSYREREINLGISIHPTHAGGLDPSGEGVERPYYCPDCDYWTRWYEWGSFTRSPCELRAEGESQSDVWSPDFLSGDGPDDLLNSEWAEASWGDGHLPPEMRGSTLDQLLSRENITDWEDGDCDHEWRALVVDGESQESTFKCTNCGAILGLANNPAKDSA